MKRHLFIRAVVFLSIAALVACTTPASMGPKARNASPRTDSTAAGDWPNNAYFYYFAAQREMSAQHTERARELLGKAILHDPRSTFLKMEIAQLLAKEKEVPLALEIMRSATAQAPDRADALILLGKLEQEQNHPRNAVRAFEKALQLDPTQVSVYLFLGNAYLEGKDLDSAERIYERLVQQFPDYYVGHFFLGKIRSQKGDPEAAKKAFSKALALEPDLEEARYALIDVYREQKKFPEAVALYREILEKNPESLRSKLGLGLLYYQMGDLQASQRYLKPLGEASRSDPAIIRQIFNLYLDEKQYGAAAVILDAMLQGAPDDSDLHYLMGIAQDGKDDKTEAIRHLRRVDPESRFYSNAVIHTAFLLQETGNVEGAVTLLKDVIRRIPDNPDFYLYLGSFYEDMEQFDRAEATLKEGLAKDPDNAKILFRLGVVYDKSDRKDASIQTMKAVIRLDPENANALNYLGYTYAEMGRNLDEAERLIREALSQKPDDGYITDSMGWVYFKKGQFQEALEWVLKAVALVPEDPIILEHLGDIYHRLKDNAKALHYYQKSLELRDKDKVEIEKKIDNLLKLMD